MIPIVRKLFTNEVFVLSGVAAAASGWEVAADAPGWVPVVGAVSAALLAGRQIGPSVKD